MIEIVFGSKAHELSIRQTLFSLIGQWLTVNSTQHCFTSLTNVFFFFFFFLQIFLGGGGGLLITIFISTVLLQIPCLNYG